MKGLDKFSDELKKIIEEVTKSSNMKKYALEAVELIRLRTRLGYGVKESGGVKNRLKALNKETTVERRKQMRKDGELSELTSPGKSNLTATGQLLDSLKIIKVGQGEAVIGPSGGRTDGLTNEEVARHVTEAGRAFNNLSKTETKRISDSLSKDIRAAISRKLK